MTTTCVVELRIENNTTNKRQKTLQYDFPALQRLATCHNNGESNARCAQIGCATSPAIFPRALLLLIITYFGP